VQREPSHHEPGRKVSASPPLWSAPQTPAITKAVRTSRRYYASPPSWTRFLALAPTPPEHPEWFLGLNTLVALVTLPSGMRKPERTRDRFIQKVDATCFANALGIDHERHVLAASHAAEAFSYVH